MAFRTHLGVMTPGGDLETEDGVIHILGFGLPGRVGDPYCVTTRLVDGVETLVRCECLSNYTVVKSDNLYGQSTNQQNQQQ